MKFLFLFLIIICHTSMALQEFIIGASIGKLQAEIGLFESTNDNPKLLESITKPMQAIANFNEFVRETYEYFCKKYNVKVLRACLGVSGNTQETKDYIQSPHLAFAIDGKVIAQQCNMQKVYVINDFEIMGYSLNIINQKFITTLNAGKLRINAPKLLVGAGNGLGSALVIVEESSHHTQIVPLAAAFTDFMPFNEQELDFANFIRKRVAPDSNASWGYVLGSKGGIVAVYEYFAQNSKRESLDAQTIFSKRFTDDLCKKAVEFYMSLYIRLIRNAAYFVMPYGGVYITNKVAQDNPELFEDPAFLSALFDGKNKMLKAYLAEIPIYLITDKQVGLYGAAYYLLNQPH